MSKLDLRIQFPSMTPVKSPPPLYRINGCGVGMYGHRDDDAETGTYISTWCLSLVFLPVACLRAYRVANAENGGWYFIGREPLSTLARSCNLVLMLAIAGIIGLWQYDSYTSTPAYKAQRKMAEASQLVDRGQLAQAAAIYQRLALAGADQAHNATAALGSLLDKQCIEAPLAQCAGVYAAASRIAHNDGAVPPEEVLAKGLKLSDARALSDPRGGLALLESVRPLTVDTRPIDARRLTLLRKWAAAEPDNLDALCPLASLLETQNQLEEARKILTPVRAKLGIGEGARVLGTILARQGEYDGAYALLWPYVKDRLDKLHAAEKTYGAVMTALWDRQIKLLNDNKAPRDFYSRYKSASQSQQQEMVDKYVSAQIKDDPQYLSAQESLRHESSVVPAALELGIVMLERAQAQPDAAQRKTQLEAAEQTFLAIGGFAGEADEYRLSLGQVRYWLGKQAEGRKLFDEFLAAKGRDSGSLLAVGATLRNLGAVPEARVMAEEAFAKAAKPEQGYDAAGLRALCNKDLDDKIAWLNKSNTASPVIKAKLADAMGAKARVEGRDGEAATQFRNAIDAYNAMPRSAMTLNETARAWYDIYAITGDRTALDRSFENFQQALDLNPGDPILLCNAADTLMAAALGDVVKADIDLLALHERGGFYLLSYVYRDKSGRDAMARRVKDHPGVARALSYYEKVMVVSPKSTYAYAWACQIHYYTHNDTALEALAKRVEGAVFDYSDEIASTKEFITGAKDEQTKVELAAGLKRLKECSATVRAKGGRTLAVALGRQVQQMLAQDRVQGNADPREVMALAQEADRACPSTATAWNVIAAHLLQASKDLCNGDPAFAAFYGRYKRSLSLFHVMAAAAGESKTLQQRILQNADVQKAMALLRQQTELFPDTPAVYHWALLRYADPAEAGKTADVIRKNRRQLAEQAISICLHPGIAEEALTTSWLMQICGNPSKGAEALRKAADLGIPVPEQH